MGTNEGGGEECKVVPLIATRDAQPEQKPAVSREQRRKAEQKARRDRNESVIRSYRLRRKPGTGNGGVK